MKGIDSLYLRRWPNARGDERVRDSSCSRRRDIIELGLPFSDPVADGPTIQAGIQRALDGGMTPDIYFRTISSLKLHIPLIVMTYYNLVFKRGLDKFVKDCAASGISGINSSRSAARRIWRLVTDLQEERSWPDLPCAPTTTESRNGTYTGRGTALSTLWRALASQEHVLMLQFLRRAYKRVKTNTPKAVVLGYQQATRLRRSFVQGPMVLSSVGFREYYWKQKERVWETWGAARELKGGAARGSCCNPFIRFIHMPKYLSNSSIFLKCTLLSSFSIYQVSLNRRDWFFYEHRYRFHLLLFRSESSFL